MKLKQQLSGPESSESKKTADFKKNSCTVDKVAPRLNCLHQEHLHQSHQKQTLSRHLRPNLMYSHLYIMALPVLLNPSVGRQCNEEAQHITDRVPNPPICQLQGMHKDTSYLMPHKQLLHPSVYQRVHHLTHRAWSHVLSLH
jgi:hypothetical protein